MRSEKEIKEKDLNRLCVDLMKEDQSRIKEWLFEGESRYSVAELERILDSDEFNLNYSYDSAKDLIDFLSANEEKVEKILNEK